MLVLIFLLTYVFNSLYKEIYVYKILIKYEKRFVQTIMYT